MFFSTFMFNFANFANFLVSLYFLFREKLLAWSSKLKNYCVAGLSTLNWLFVSIQHCLTW